VDDAVCRHSRLTVGIGIALYYLVLIPLVIIKVFDPNVLKSPIGDLYMTIIFLSPVGAALLKTFINAVITTRCYPEAKGSVFQIFVETYRSSENFE